MATTGSKGTLSKPTGPESQLSLSEQEVNGVRFPQPDETLFEPLKVTHKLLTAKRDHDVFYAVFRPGVILIRPVEGVLVAVLGRNKLNLGRVLQIPGGLEARGG